MHRRISPPCLLKVTSSLRWCSTSAPAASSTVGAAAPTTKKDDTSASTPPSAGAQQQEEPLVPSGFNAIGEGENEFVGFVKQQARPSGKLPCDDPNSDFSKSGGGGGDPALAGQNMVDELSEEKARAMRSSPNHQDKKEVWKRMRAKQAAFLMDEIAPSETTELEYVKLENEIKEEDRFHWRLGQLAIDDEQLRRDYYALHVLAMKLNLARWKMLENKVERGKPNTAVGIRSMFWKEAVNEIIDKRAMASGQFVNGHPILRPFADCVRRRKLTKTFLRGFLDARLKVLDQPANMQQLFDHFDKFHGHFLNTQLELFGVKNDIAEHMMMHIGRAIGITQHCVLLWQEYARKEMTLLPANLCADNQVNLSLLRNLRIATKDKCVKKLLRHVMGHVHGEMKHVRELVKGCPTAAWPVLMEACMPNYYVEYLERNHYDVTKWFCDQQHYSPGFLWFFNKQLWRWGKTKDLSVWVDDLAPMPFLPMGLQERNRPVSMGGGVKERDRGKQSGGKF